MAEIVQTKQCSRCGLPKPVTEFHKRADRPIGIQSHCKSCQTNRKQGYLVTPTGKAKEMAHNKSYYWSNRDKALRENAAWCKIHKNERQLWHRHYAQVNAVRMRIVRQKRDKQHPETARDYQRNRYQTDLKYRLNCLMSSGVRRSLGAMKNGYHWESLVDYTLDELIRHLKSTLPDEFTWDDYINGATLHIDHIVPMSAFNFETANDTDFKRCWSLDNLRLIPAETNRAKGARLEQPFQPSFIGM